MRLFILSILIFTLGFCSCSNKSTASRKPVTNIQITPANKLVVHGNEFTIQLSSRVSKPKIESIELLINNKLVKTSSLENFSFKVNSDTLLPGKLSIKTIAKNENGKVGTNYSSVSIVSDIQPKQLSYRVVETIPHNVAYYTEGFEFHNNLLFEGTGNYDESFIYAYNPDSEKIFNSVKNDSQYFGEGITILNDKLYQLTYKSKKGFVYDVNTFEKIDEFTFTSKEGWGMTNDGHSLIMSNGTSSVIYLNPETFEIEKTIEISTPTGFISNINELEYVDGVIYANIWTRETIIKFNAKTGKVLEIINMKGLMSQFTGQRIDVLNGIAYNENEDLFYVTGKWWPKTFKVQFE